MRVESNCLIRVSLLCAVFLPDFFLSFFSLSFFFLFLSFFFFLSFFLPVCQLVCLSLFVSLHPSSSSISSFPPSHLRFYSVPPSLSPFSLTPSFFLSLPCLYPSFPQRLPTSYLSPPPPLPLSLSHTHTKLPFFLSHTNVKERKAGDTHRSVYSKGPTGACNVYQIFFRKK